MKWNTEWNWANELFIGISAGVVSFFFDYFPPLDNLFVEILKAMLLVVVYLVFSWLIKVVIRYFQERRRGRS